MRNLKISAAVVATLVSASAMALPPNTASYGVTLNGGGASAQLTTFRAAVVAICVPGTLDEYVATNGFQFRAFSCTLNNATFVPASLQGLSALIRYRTEGGSIYGVATVAKQIPVKTLVVNASCTSAAVFPATDTCPVATYDLATDAGTGNIVNAQVELGGSDVEARLFTGENYPASTGVLGSTPTPAQYATVSSFAATGTVFGIAVHDDGAAATSVAATNLTRQDITSIFSGSYGTWDQVPNNAGTAPVDTGTITVCRRVRGSGTQTFGSVFFNGFGCSPASYAFVSAPTGPLYGNPVIENSSGTDVAECVRDNANSIGLLDFDATPVLNNRFVSINGTSPGKVNAALGKYEYWSEAVYNKGVAIQSNALGSLLADTIIARAGVAATIPVSDVAFALYNGGVNTPVIPPDPTRPIALGTRSGNSCFLPQGQNF